MTKLKFRVVLVLLASLSVMVTPFHIFAQTETEDTCTSTVEPVATTDPTTAEYTRSEEPIIETTISGTTYTYTVSYSISGTATVDDYGMVYAASRVNFREDPSYEWADIEDLMEVGTVVQACGEEDGDFIEVQLLDESVSVINEYSPDIALEGDTGWMYATYFEPIEFEVSATEERVLTLTLTEEDLALYVDPITGIVTDPIGLDAYLEEQVRLAIAEDVATYEFEEIVVTDELGSTEIETWQENLMTAEGEEWDALRAIYLNEDGELSDATSLDNGGEEEGALENSSANNGQFEEGRTNEFGCDGYGNSCENRSEKAQANGNTNNVNKFGCVGRGNSCNAGKDKDKSNNGKGK